MKNLLIIISVALMLFSMWVANIYGTDYIAAPSAAAIVTLLAALFTKTSQVRKHKLVLTALTAIFLVIAIIAGLKNPGAKMMTAIAIPAAFTLFCFIASCLDEVTPTILGAIWVMVFAVAWYFNKNALWLVGIPIFLKIAQEIRNAGEENDKINNEYIHRE